MYTCSLRPTGVYGDGDELIRDFYKQCVQRGGVVVQGVPEHIEHGRVYVGEPEAPSLEKHQKQKHRFQPQRASCRRQTASHSLSKAWMATQRCLRVSC